VTTAPTLWTDSSGVDHEVTPSQLFRLTVTDDGTAPCWLAQACATQLDTLARDTTQRNSIVPCDGPLDAAHLIRAQKIRHAFPFGAWRWPSGEWTPIVRAEEMHGLEGAVERRTLDELVYDPSIGVPACRRHHGMLDTARTLRIPREALPEGVTEFARAFGLLWWLDTEYTHRETEAA
jgi:hypothetical protein